MNMIQYYVAVLKKYAVFSGRARRAEYWYFTLCNIIIAIILYSIDLALHTQVLAYLYPAAIFIPSLALTVRRLHDIDHSGWWILIGFIPFIGGLILLLWAIRKGTSGPNKYGPDPKDINGSTVPPKNIDEHPNPMV